TIYFANLQTLDSREAAERYVARLEAIPDFLRDLQDNLRAGRAAGIRYPKRVLECGVGAQRASLAAVPACSPWYGPLKRSRHLADPRFAKIAEQGLKLVEDKLYPALQAYGDFLGGTLSEGARSSISCMDSPQGTEFYRALVRQFTTLDLTPEEIHELG